MGAYVVQLASLSGLTVIATCSERNFEVCYLLITGSKDANLQCSLVQYVRSLGATHVLDYSKPDVVDQIKKLSGGNLRLAYDTIGRCDF